MSKKRKHQKKSKTVKSKKQSKKASRIKYPFSGNNVRRRDARGNYYYINKYTGKRVSKEEYEDDKYKLEVERVRYRQHIKDDLDGYDSIDPFPPNVSSFGVPTKKIDNEEIDFSDLEGESFEVEDFEAIPIEGEDETG